MANRVDEEMSGGDIERAVGSTRLLNVGFVGSGRVRSPPSGSTQPQKYSLRKTKSKSLHSFSTSKTSGDPSEVHDNHVQQGPVVPRRATTGGCEASMSGNRNRRRQICAGFTRVCGGAAGGGTGVVGVWRMWANKSGSHALVVGIALGMFLTS